MRIRVLLFARLRELCGSESLVLEMPDDANPTACFDRLVQKHPELAASRGRVMVAVNERYADWTESLREGDEVAFIPPVSGG